MALASCMAGGPYPLAPRSDASSLLRVRVVMRVFVTIRLVIEAAILAAIIVDQAIRFILSAGGYIQAEQ